MDKLKSMGIQLTDKAATYIEANPEKVEEMKAQPLDALKKKIDEEAEKAEALMAGAGTEEETETTPTKKRGDKLKAQAVSELKPQIDKLAETQAAVVAAAAADAGGAADNDDDDDDDDDAAATMKSTNSNSNSNDADADISSSSPTSTGKQDLVKIRGEGSANIPIFKLASGYEMPVVAYGTFRSNPVEVHI